MFLKDKGKTALSIIPLYLIALCIVFWGAPTASDAAPSGVSVNFTQCANDDVSGSKNDGIIDHCEWINGAINHVNSKYAESDAVPQRFIFTHGSAVSNASHTVSFRYDFTKGSIHTYDFMVDPDHTMPFGYLDHCGNMPSFANVDQCNVALGIPSFSNMQMVNIPSDSFDSVPLHEHPATRYIHYACADITDPNNPTPLNSPACTITGIAIHHRSASDPTGPDIPACTQDCGDTVAIVDVTFVHPAGSVLIGMWFGGELSPSFDPDGLFPAVGWGYNSTLAENDTASNAAGASFDFRLVSITGASIGSQVDQILPIEAGHNSDLAITKSCPTNVIPGNDVSYTITVTNNGPESATDVYFIDALPAGVTYVSAVPSANPNGSPTSCTDFPGSPEQVQCDLGLLQPGDSITAVIVVAVPSSFIGSSITDNVEVFGNVVDPVSANNSDSCTTNVGTQTSSADLSVTKSDSPDPVVAGNNLTYTITVHNGGPNNATNVVLVDSVPSVLVSPLISITPSQGSCSESPSHVVTCNLGTINYTGDTSSDVTITIVATVNPSVRGIINNVATVSSDITDPNTDNNSVTDPTTVIGSVNLTTEKTDSQDPVPAGSAFSYTITVSNSGPSTALNVAVTDVLPAGLHFVSGITSASSACSFDGTTVTCDLGNIPPSGSAFATINVYVDLSVTPGTVIHNEACASSDETSEPVCATQDTTVSAPLPGVPVPTMTDWGMILFTLIAGVGSVYYLRRKSMS